MTTDRQVRELLDRLLSWEAAHVGFDTAVADMPVRLRGKKPAGLPHSAWQLLEHLRLAQHDILEFCRNPEYRELEWPKDFWPASPRPPSAKAWSASVAAYRKDRAALRKIARDPKLDLTAAIPHGDGPTYLVELVLAADHAAYHLGQLVLVRQALGAWKTG